MITGAYKCILSSIKKGYVKDRDAEDIMQDASMKLWKFRLSFNDNRGSEGAFGYTVAWKCICSFYGRAKLETETLQESIVGGFDAGCGFSYDDVVRCIDQWTGSLSERNRKIVEMSAVGFKAGEIAEELGINQNTVSVFLTRFRGRHQEEYAQMMAA